MRRLLAVLLLVALALAAWSLAAPGEAPTVVVAPGDTLGRLAANHDVTVDQLRAWNDLAGDLIHVGDALVVGPTPPRRFPFAARDEPEIEAAEPPPPVTSTATKRPRATPTPGDERRTWPKLVRPAAKPCLDATTLGDGDASMGRSVGLDPDEVGAVVRSFQTQTLRCADEHPQAGGTIHVELAIGCDGRVLRSDVIDDGVGVPGYALCVADVMTYASFPAHARDEVVTQVPLIFRAAPQELP